jgi:hypothetical protein
MIETKIDKPNEPSQTGKINNNKTNYNKNCRNKNK